MRVDLFDFDLPETLIALRPAVPRDAARLLVASPDGTIADRNVRDLPGLLRAGDTLVLNDTKVIRARLAGTRERPESTARIEAMLHTRHGADRWRALARPAKRLRLGDTIRFAAAGLNSPACALGELEAVVEDIGASGDIGLRFSISGVFLDEAVERLGRIPLPPYIEGKRQADDRDAGDYQTAYAAVEGAVAAPTAGLHFTPDLFGRLEAAGIGRALVTLHVGAGTFLPVKVDDTDDHRMHAEWGSISPETAAALNATRARGGRIVAVGTTSLRLLESAADATGTIQPFEGWTDIFITPGYRFRAVDVMMTNFHLPRSTLFMLVSAFGGTERMRRVYEHAIGRGYRFYSYGDSSLLFTASRGQA